MRTIDADKLIEATKSFCERYEVKWTLNKVLAWIDHAPTIDAVKVVRCKDCKWFSKNNGGSWVGCQMYYAIKACEADAPCESDYCSYGERKTT